MPDEALWDELLALAGKGVGETDAPYQDSFARVARIAALGRRLGLDTGATDLLKQDELTPEALEAFYKRVWRLATLQAEARRIERMEARRGVDKDAADFRHLRESLDEARVMILDFAWLPEKRKRLCLDRLESLTRELQRARDDFDVAYAGVHDPELARHIEVNPYSPWREALRKVAAFLGPADVGGKQPQPRRSLPPPDPRDEE